jgi:hypothetical protein
MPRDEVRSVLEMFCWWCGEREEHFDWREMDPAEIGALVDEFLDSDLGPVLESGEGGR